MISFLVSFSFFTLYIQKFIVGQNTQKICFIVRMLCQALAETALWLLPEGLACAVGAKANVPFAGRHKIELKKCAVGKIKNTEGSAMGVGLLVVRL
jgi:hypothetical protein